MVTRTLFVVSTRRLRFSARTCARPDAGMTGSRPVGYVGQGVSPPRGKPRGILFTRKAKSAEALTRRRQGYGGPPRHSPPRQATGLSGEGG